MAGTSSSPLYSADPVPSDPGQIGAYVSRELEKIQRAILLLAAGHVDMTYVAPAKPRDGDIRLSDGVHWDPVAAGAPRFVGYYSAGWHSLG